MTSAAELIGSVLNKKDQHAWLRTIGQNCLADGARLPAALVADVLGAKSHGEVTGLDALNGSGAAAAQPIELVTAVSGINRIVENGSLPFSIDRPKLSVVYGDNGSGKTGYGRILKFAAGRSSRPLGDQFAATPAPSAATIKLDGIADAFSLDDMDSQKPLRGCWFFDTEYSRQLIETPKGLEFLPKALQYVADLRACVDEFGGSHVVSELRASEADLIVQAQLDVLDPELSKLLDDESSTPVDVADSVLAATMSETEQQGKIKDLDVRIGDLSARTPEALRRDQQTLTQLRDSLSSLREAVLGETGVSEARKLGETYRKSVIAVEAAAKVYADLPIGELSSAEWEALWKHAEAFARKASVTFPPSHGDDRCPLCQTEVGDHGVTYFELMRKFTIDETVTNRDAAKAALDDRVVLLNDRIAKFKQVQWEQSYRRVDGGSALGAALAEQLEAQVTWIENGALESPPHSDDAKLFSAVETALQAVTDELRADPSTAQRELEELRKSRTHAESHGWCRENRDGIQRHVAARRRISQIKALQSQITGVKSSLTGLAKKVADEVVTDQFQDAFRDEMEALGAEHLGVSLERSPKAAGGTPEFHIVLKNASGNAGVTEVFSEGERRLISLGLLLAEIGVMESTSPVIFDDPVTSLDHHYEEAVAERLLDLAVTNQVLCFTHRIPFVVALHDIDGDRNGGKTPNVDASYLYSSLFDASTGHQGLNAHTYEASQVTKALKELSKKLEQLTPSADGDDAQTIRGYCGQLREFTERVMEEVVLGGVIQRFSGDVRTGKFPKLREIHVDDLSVMHGLMSFYSKFVHARRAEAPPALPTVQKLKDDAAALGQVIEDSKLRSVIMKTATA